MHGWHAGVVNECATKTQINRTKDDFVALQEVLSCVRACHQQARPRTYQRLPVMHARHCTLLLFLQVGRLQHT